MARNGLSGNLQARRPWGMVLEGFSIICLGGREPLKGLIRPFKSLIRPFKGLIRPLKGFVRAFKGRLL